MTYTVRTAIVKNTKNNEVSAVMCRVENDDLKASREVLVAEHPDCEFLGWVYDLENPYHRQELQMWFLSPNVMSVRKWIDTPQGFVEKRVTRAMVA